MKVRDLDLQPVVGTAPDESLAKAADTMRFFEIGALAVLDHGELVGIITDRDLARAVADRADPDEMTVRFYMTSDPTTISADADVREAGSLMLAVGGRHLPVIDDAGIASMISLRDVAVVELAALVRTA